jgi:Holliday junction resolvase RusA-like endonuclease
METLKFRVNIEGYPTPRARLAKNGQAYNTAKYRTYKKKLAGEFVKMGVPKGDYEYVRINFYFPYPTNTAQKNIVDKAPMRYKYDVDNLIKGFFDALQDAGIVEDDRTIAAVYSEKLFTVENFGFIEFEFE